MFFEKSKPKRSPARTSSLNMLRVQSPKGKQSQGLYVCHLNNGIYMGGMQSFKLHDCGILLLDDGTSAITSYQRGTLVGQSLIIRDNSIISIVADANHGRQLIYRTQGYFFKLFLKDEIPQYSTVVDITKQQISYVRYQSGKIIQRILEADESINRSVFHLKKIEGIIGIEHHKLLTLNSRQIGEVTLKKQHNKITIGYLNSKGQIHGLGFEFTHIDQWRYPLKFELKRIQRGFFLNNKLTQFGERHFNNSNIYIGQFQNDNYDGIGIIIYTNQQKWLKGNFSKGCIISVQDITLSETAANDNKSWMRELKLIHQSHGTHWIDLTINLDSQINLFSKLHQVLVTDFNSLVRGPNLIQHISARTPLFKTLSTNKSIYDLPGSTKNYTIPSSISARNTNRNSRIIGKSPPKSSFDAVSPKFVKSKSKIHQRSQSLVSAKSKSVVIQEKKYTSKHENATNSSDPTTKKSQISKKIGLNSFKS